MPVRKCQKDGVSGYKAHDTGPCFTGKDGKMKAQKQYVAIQLSKQKKGEPSEFDKASLPTTAMTANAKLGLELRSKYGKGGENLVVLSLAQHIAANDFISHEDIDVLLKQYNKRERYASANEDTMGYINFLLLGGTATREWLNSHSVK